MTAARRCRATRVRIGGGGVEGAFFVLCVDVGGRIALQTEPKIQTSHPKIQIHSTDFLAIPCDVLVPAAIGGVINSRTAPRLQCKVGLLGVVLFVDVDDDDAWCWLF